MSNTRGEILNSKVSSSLLSNFIKKIFVSEDNAQQMAVPDFYSGRSVLVTGFTGLLGKLAVEKLLWSCPDAFDRVRNKYPEALETKLIPIVGDLSSDSLGLSNEDRITVCRDVSVVIHSAASVRFDDSLGVAVKMNMIGSKMLLDLAVNMSKIVCFLHVSTAYSNCDQMVIKEEMYPAKMDWNNMIKVTDNIDPETLQILSQKFMDEVPNTYIFTKALTEHIVNDYRDRLPVAIVRPAVVAPAYKEPVPGWIDNKFGPLGINIAYFTGIVRCSWGDDQNYVNFVHTDFVTNSILLAAYKKAVYIESDSETPVYNACSPPYYKCTHKDYMLLHQHPSTEKYLNQDGINYFSSRFIKSSFWYRINVIYRHMISALLIDLLLIIMKKPPMLTKIRRGLLIGNQRLKYFIDNRIFFHVDKFLNLPNILNESDMEHFGYNFDHCDMQSVYHKALVLSKQVLLKPLYKNIGTVRKILKWLYYMDNAAVLLTYLTAIWLLYMLDICGLIFGSLINICTIP